MNFFCWPANADIYDIYIEYVKKKRKKKKNRNLMSTLKDSRRAPWVFRGVLDESLFLYMKFEMN